MNSVTALMSHRIGWATMNSKSASALFIVIAAVFAVAMGGVVWYPVRQIAEQYQVQVSRAKTVAVQHETSTAITERSTIQSTIIAVYPDSTQTTVDNIARGIPASEAQPEQVEATLSREIPVTYAPALFPPRLTSPVISQRAIIDTATVEAATQTATSSPIPFQVIAVQDTPDNSIIVFPTPQPTPTDIAPTVTIEPTVTIAPIPTPQTTETPKPTDTPPATITPVPVVIVTDTVEPTATVTSVLISPIATPTEQATATP